jgi:hypothetical protein
MKSITIDYAVFFHFIVQAPLSKFIPFRRLPGFSSLSIGSTLAPVLGVTSLKKT